MAPPGRGTRLGRGTRARAGDGVHGRVMRARTRTRGTEAEGGWTEPMARTRRYDVAASGRWWDPEDNRWLPAGEVHAWEQGTNQTVCGLSLHRSQLSRFPAVTWADALPESGGAADAVRRVCPRCAAAAGRRGAGARPARRHINPRP